MSMTSDVPTDGLQLIPTKEGPAIDRRLVNLRFLQVATIAGQTDVALMSADETMLQTAEKSSKHQDLPLTGHTLRRMASLLHLPLPVQLDEPRML